MRCQKMLGIGMVILLLVSSTTLFFVSGEETDESVYKLKNEKDSIKKSMPGPMPRYTPHAPIRIDGNGDFSAVATGSGTQGDPWLIEGYEIDGNGNGYCIYIGNTTDYFIVKDCYVHDASGKGGDLYFRDTGIYLNNVANGSFDNNTATSNDRYGIYLDSSSNNSMNFNNASDNQYGFFLRSSDDNTMKNNTASSNTQDGFYVRESNSNVIGNNTVSKNNQHGTWVYDSDNNLLENNHVFSNAGNGIVIDWYSISNTINNNNASSNDGTGIVILRESNTNTVSNNTASSNLANGINLRDSHSNTVNNNTASGNIGNGIHLDLSSADNIMRNNTVSLNDNYGFFLDSASGNTIYHNYIINNANQAYVNVTNQWNMSYPIGGNYWSDYSGDDNYSGQNQDQPFSDGIGDDPYLNIDGPAGARDEYPLMYPTTELATASLPPPLYDGKENETATQPYFIKFSKKMNTSLEPSIEPTPIQGSWAWDNTGTWCNYTVSSGFPVLWEGGMKYWVNITDLEDEEEYPVTGDTNFNFTIVGGAPIVTNVTGSPLENVSRNNKMDVRATFEDPHIDMGLAMFLKDVGGNATLDNYTIIEQVEGSLKANPDPDLDNFSATWNATSGYDSHTTAGYLTDGTEQDYMEINRWWDDFNSEWNYGFNVYYTNNTLNKEWANLQFYSDGSPKGLWVNGSGQEDWINSADFNNTMSVIPRVDIISFNKSDGKLASPVGGGNYGEYGQEYALPDVSFEVDHLVPSDTYPWFVAAVDEGWNIGYNMSDTPVSVDNNPPTIIYSTHADGATGVSTDAGEYNIHFSEPINTTNVLISGNLPDADWTWSSDTTWLNGTYSQLEGGKRYTIDINNVEDFAKNWLPYDEAHLNFTAAAPWATITGPESDGTNNGTPTITYDYGNNPSGVVIWYTTDGGETWDQKAWDKPADGKVVLNETSGLPGSGAYHFSARTTGEIDEPEPNSPDDIEGGAYVLDMDQPTIVSTSPDTHTSKINRSAGTYVIEFSEEMQTDEVDIESTLPDISWEWDDTGRWLNGTYGDLEGNKDYYVNLTRNEFLDLVGNELEGDDYTLNRSFHTERGPWAQAGWALSEGSYNRRPEVQYSVSDASSVEIYYTDDNGTTWAYWGTDENGNGSWIPDSDLPGPGTYNWNCRAMGYVNEPVPDGPEFIESEDYLLLESTETVEIESTIPDDGETSVGLNGDTYAIEFTVDMQKKRTPDSNLPNVSWSWRYDGRWLNGSYDVLEPSTTYYVDLGAGDFQSISGAYLTGDMNRSFTTRSEDETATGTVEGQVTDENGDPIEGATVTIPGTDISTTTDEDGYYTLEDVPVGEHTVKITHPDYDDQESSVDIEEGGTEDTGTSQLPAKEGEAVKDWMFIVIAIMIVVVIVVVLAVSMSKRKQPVEPEMVPEEESFEEDIDETWDEEPEDTLED
ncbi:MAG: NosD domain-containing protein [Thermoplasmata archaeon]